MAQVGPTEPWEERSSGTLSADLLADEYSKVSLANKAGDDSDYCSALGAF